jgi:hypothetical protein
LPEVFAHLAVALVFKTSSPHTSLRHHARDNPGSFITEHDEIGRSSGGSRGRCSGAAFLRIRPAASRIIGRCRAGRGNWRGN